MTIAYSAAGTEEYWAKRAYKTVPYNWKGKQRLRYYYRPQKTNHPVGQYVMAYCGGALYRANIAAHFVTVSSDRYICYKYEVITKTGKRLTATWVTAIKERRK